MSGPATADSDESPRISRPVRIQFVLQWRYVLTSWKGIVLDRLFVTDAITDPCFWMAFCALPQEAVALRALTGAHLGAARPIGQR
jgi:hypothetical protein